MNASQLAGCPLGAIDPRDDLQVRAWADWLEDQGRQDLAAEVRRLEGLGRRPTPSLKLLGKWYWGLGGYEDTHARLGPGEFAAAAGEGLHFCCHKKVNGLNILLYYETAALAYLAVAQGLTKR